MKNNRKKISKYIFSTSIQFLGFSIACPWFHHRYYIETMDLIWSYYGVTMEYLRRKSYKKAEFPARKLRFSQKSLSMVFSWEA